MQPEDEQNIWKSFDAFFNNFEKKEPEKLKRVYYCYECDNKKVISDYAYVCTQCGVISGQQEVASMYGEMLTYHPNLRYYAGYSRNKYFNKVLKKDIYINPDLDRKLNLMFNEINKYFTKNVTHRKSFIKYNYVIIKLLSIMDRDELQDNFRMPTRRKTLKKYDKIWKEICGRFDYPFTPSIKKRVRKRDASQ